MLVFSHSGLTEYRICISSEVNNGDGTPCPSNDDLPLRICELVSFRCYLHLVYFFFLQCIICCGIFVDSSSLIGSPFYGIF